MSAPSVAREHVHRLEEHVRRVAELRPGDRLELLGVASLPARAAALGATRAEGLVGERLVAWVRDRPESKPIVLEVPSDLDGPTIAASAAPGGRVILRGVLPLEIQSFEYAPMILALQQIEGAIFVLEGDDRVTQWNLGALLLNLDVGRAIVHLVTANQEAVLVGEPGEPGGLAGRVTAFGVVRAVPEALAELSGWVPVPPPVLEVDTRALLRGDEPCERWLEEQFTRLGSSARAVDRLAAAGLLARLWLPADGARRAEPASSREGLPRRVRAWAAALDRALLESVEATAAARAETLAEELDALSACAIERPDDVTPVALRIVHARDDLESVAYVLDAALGDAPAPGRALRSALDAFDREAETHLSEFGFAEGLPDDERILAVSWREPDAWWGVFASS